MKTEKEYNQWWANEGSAMSPNNGEDLEEFMHRLTRIAWSNGEHIAEHRSKTELFPIATSRPYPAAAKRWSVTKQNRTRVTENTSQMIEVGGLMGRRPTTLWTVYEAIALDDINPQQEELDLMSKYYLAWMPREKDYRRRDLTTLLNNWNGELDRARAWVMENKRRGA